MSVVPTDDSSVVGVVGRGYIATLIAKLAALRGFKTWMLCPSGQEENISNLVGNQQLMSSNLEVIASSDAETWQGEKLPSTDALVFAVDGDVPLDAESAKFMIENAPKLKRAVVMSRNLNGKDMGFLVKASKAAANAEVWDLSTAKQYQHFEETVKRACSKLDNNPEYTIVRAGTLKGGACGEGEYNQYLSSAFYDMNQKDIINWQLLFDCRVRGVLLEKGDVMPGPGSKAVFAAVSPDPSPGDTSRCSIAEAIVRSLSVECAGNADFGIGTAESRLPPTDKEWEKLFSVL